MTDAFDSDVIIYAAVANELGERIEQLIAANRSATVSSIGSVILLPETLSKPTRLASHDEVRSLTDLLARLTLLPVDERTADAATELGARYGLRAADAIHLATAVVAGADRFVTNNRREFPRTITEVDVVYPDDLPD